LKQSLTNTSWYLLRPSAEQPAYVAVPLWYGRPHLQNSLRLRPALIGRWASGYAPHQANLSGYIRLDAAFPANQSYSGYTTSTLENLDRRHDNLRLLVKI